MSALLLGLVAAAASSVPVDVTGKCPGADAVAAALQSALGKDVPARAGAAAVTDRGDRFSVSAAGQTRELADPARDCDERARAAAVFIALALNPPLAPAPPPVRDVPAPPPAAPVESARWLELAAAARLDGGGAAETPLAIGVELGAAAGWRWLGLAATAGILAPTETRYSSVTVRQQRFPLSLAITARRRLSPLFAISGAAGAALVPLTLRAQDIAGAPTSTRLDAGLRLALELHVHATGPLAPFVGLHAEIFPRAYELDADPLGQVGSTGGLWLGGSLGLSFEAMPRSSLRREPNQVSASL